jgi:hypothetical protein
MEGGEGERERDKGERGKGRMCVFCKCVSAIHTLSFEMCKQRHTHTYTTNLDVGQKTNTHVQTYTCLERIIDNNVPIGIELVRSGGLHASVSRHVQRARACVFVRVCASMLVCVCTCFCVCVSLSLPPPSRPFCLSVSLSVCVRACCVCVCVCVCVWVGGWLATPDEARVGLDARGNRHHINSSNYLAVGRGERLWAGV